MPTEYEPVVGLEVHAQLLTRTKAFCACAAGFGGEPNTSVCPVCLGLPGALPVLNAGVVEMALRASLALGGTVREHSVFARKNYFYPDLPKGYQITQFDQPLSLGGALELDGGKRARITRVHIEEDAGKTLHGAASDSVVDLNRAGVPLIEIVGEPDLGSGAEAAEYLRALREILIYLGVNDGNLEEGSFRCDANVSVRPRGESRLGTRVELKNINSFRFVQKAIDHEVSRQCAALEAGKVIVQETRGWDEKTGSTYSMRSKEEANDYRYFPEPDLPPLVVHPREIEAARVGLPELPRAKRARFVAELRISVSAAQVLTAHPRVAAFYEAAAKLHGDPVRVANFVQSEVLRDVVTDGLSASIPVSPRQVAELLLLVDAGTLSGKQAKDVYLRLVAYRRENPGAKEDEPRPAAVVKDLGIAQVSDEGQIEASCRKVIDANPKQAAALRAGKTSLLGFFVGLVMKETGGRANPQLVNEALRRLLGSPAAAPAPMPRRAPGRVLIVDDNVELVGTLQAVLSRATGTEGGEPSRLEVVTASRGDEALASARAHGFDVAIVDVKLPDTSGVDLIEPLRAASPHGEVVLITGFASVDAAIGALRSGAFAFVLKSFRPEELISTVDQALAKVRLQRDREELESRYRALVQLTDVLAVAADTDGKVALFNRKAAHTSGVTAAAALGKDFVETFIAPSDWTRVREAIAQARTGERTSEVEAGFVADPSPPRRIRWHLSSERKGLAVGLVYAVGIDVTERRSLEKRAADAEALSTMGTLAMNLAHEVRNPLNAAVLQLHLLERDVGKLHLEESKSKALLKRTEIVGAEIGRLNRLLTEFLDLARPRGIAREPVHLGSLVEEVLLLESGTAASFGVTLERSLEAEGCVAIGDREKLKQVVINLVVNAIEAMKTGGTLSARVACEGGKVLLTVEDTGVGIEPAHMHEVFEPFFTTKEAGTGLGLSIVRKIIDQHGGDVRIESHRGKGTRVTVAIPAGRSG